MLRVTRQRSVSNVFLESNTNSCANVLNDRLTAVYTGHVTQGEVAVLLT
jgi:hypothetical protein